MTNRTNIRPYSAGVTIKTIKKPRLRRFDLTFDGPPPPTPEGISNGMRPHGGYRGMRPLPPGQYAFNKGEEYQHELDEEYRILVNNESFEAHGAPYWLSEVQRETTHSGESPLFTNNLLSSGKTHSFLPLKRGDNMLFEQEQGEVSFERTVLYGNNRRPLAPRRRHLNGRKEYYRPNSTHQYLSATDLRNLHENEENMVKYGRPTRTTLLRARQRTNSAPVNAYDIRRENTRRSEDVKSNSIFHTSKEYLNIYATEGESIHSFLTGARYNRAHLVDSKGLSVYGVYMPRGHPSDCFITGPRRLKDVGDEIPSAPPDSPRSDIDETPSPMNISRPTSSRHISLPPSSRASSGRPTTKHSTSRPHSLKKPSSRQSSSSRPRSAKDYSTYQSTANTRTHPQSPDKKELPLPDEVTMAMPDHINKGKQGVYVTLKGQKIIESVDSKLPRVTGVSLPKIQHKPRDYVDEMLYVNQPPPTPVETSVVTFDKNKLEASNVDGRSIHQIEEQAVEEEIQHVPSDKKENTSEGKVEKEDKTKEVNKEQTIEKKDTTISQIVESENVMTDKKSLEIGPIKKVNFEDQHEMKAEETDKTTSAVKDTNIANERECVVEKDVHEKTDKVVFFMTEEDQTDEQKEEKSENIPDNKKPGDKIIEEKNVTDEKDDVQTVEKENGESLDGVNDTEADDRTVEDVIKVEISETEKNTEESKPAEREQEIDDEEEKPVTSNSYPFDGSND